MSAPDEAPIVRTLLRHYIAARALDRITGHHGIKGSHTKALRQSVWGAVSVGAKDCAYIIAAYLRKSRWLWLVMFGALIAAGVLA